MSLSEAYDVLEENIFLKALLSDDLGDTVGEAVEFIIECSI
jgi:hypothetical protein